MVILKTAYKYRAYPSKEQREVLDRQMYLSKELYNLLLDESKRYYKKTKKTLTEYRMNVWLTIFKKERPEFDELYSQVLQNVSKRVSDAYKHFFRRCKEKKKGKKVKVGFPRYKKFVSSLTYPQDNGFKIEKKRVSLSKIGRVNFVNHRDIDGKVKTCTMKKTKSREWYITFSIEREDIVPFTNGNGEAGLDVGITNYATLSDGSVFDNVCMSKKETKLLKRFQRIISRRKKGSQKRRKTILNLAKKYEHVARIREDHLHKLSYRLVHSYSLIAFEELRIANMVKNRYLAKSISESSWGNFLQLLQYKAASAGCVAVGVNPQDTSKICSQCGNIQDMSLSERTYNCGRCGISIDRDLNAAKNILKRATEGHSGSHASGDIVRPHSVGANVGERGTIYGVSR